MENSKSKKNCGRVNNRRDEGGTGDNKENINPMLTAGVSEGRSGSQQDEHVFFGNSVLT
jgi:hypothetical protein